jgi:hypothetical protein
MELELASCRPETGRYGLNERYAYRFVPLNFAWYRFAGVMGFYFYNGLRASKFRLDGLKNSPPASASARLFATELFFGKEEPGKKYHP